MKEYNYGQNRQLLLMSGESLGQGMRLGWQDEGERMRGNRTGEGDGEGKAMERAKRGRGKSVGRERAWEMRWEAWEREAERESEGEGEEWDEGQKWL